VRGKVGYVYVYMANESSEKLFVATVLENKVERALKDWNHDWDVVSEKLNHGRDRTLASHTDAAWGRGYMVLWNGGATVCSEY
jgi:hypothetical protein